MPTEQTLQDRNNGMAEGQPTTRMGTATARKEALAAATKIKEEKEREGRERREATAANKATARQNKRTRENDNTSVREEGMATGGESDEGAGKSQRIHSPIKIDKEGGTNETGGPKSILKQAPSKKQEASETKAKPRSEGKVRLKSKAQIR